jgi:hypothetical protein
MQPTAEILNNVVTMAEMLFSRNLLVPDLPYLELAKYIQIRVGRPMALNCLPSPDQSSSRAIIGHPVGSAQGGEGI